MVEVELEKQEREKKKGKVNRSWLLLSYSQSCVLLIFVLITWR
jgi:hypothetical protein